MPPALAEVVSVMLTATPLPNIPFLHHILSEGFLPSPHVVHVQGPEMIVVENGAGGVFCLLEFLCCRLSRADIPLALLGIHMPRKLSLHLVFVVSLDLVMALPVYCSASISPFVI